MGHEEVILVQDAAAGLRAVIALHDTTLGPAVGGTRMRVYPTLDEAMVDALRLARAMTYKAALAEMPRGGGKAVILGDPARDKTRALLGAYARAVDRLLHRRQRRRGSDRTGRLDVHELHNRDSRAGRAAGRAASSFPTRHRRAPSGSPVPAGRRRP